MEGMAGILLRHVRPGQKNWVEIGKNDDETVHIREGKDGKNWQKRRCLQSGRTGRPDANG